MSSRLKSNNILLIVISLIVCCTFVQALNELEVEHLQPPHFETHEINDQKNQATNQNDQLNVNLVNSKSESSTNNDERTSLTDLQSSSVVSTSSSSSSSGNLPAADQLNPRFELPPAQFSNSRQSNALQQPPNALEAALSGYGQVRKSPQFQSDSSSYSSNTNANNVANYQRQPQQMISVLSGGASLHQSVSWNPPNPPQFNSNAYSASSSSSSNNPFNNFNSAVSSQSGNNNEFVPSSPPKVHETNDYTSHDVHVNSRPHSIPVEATRELNRELSRDSSVTISSGAPLQNSRQFESQPVVSAPVEKPVVESSQPANGKQKPAHTVVKGDGKKDDVVIYYYYYYDDDKNKTTTGSSTASPSLDVIPSLDQYDNVPVKKVAPVVESIIPSTQSPKPLNVQPIVPVQHQSNNAALNKPTEFKIDGNTFKFDTTGFTPITSTPSTVAYQNNNLFRGQDRGVHVHPNPLYGNDVSSPTTSTTTTTTTTTTTQAPTTSTKPVAESIDERKPNFGGRRRFGGNSVAPAVRSSSQSSSNSVSSNVPANTRGSNTNSNSNLSSSRSRSRLTPSSTTTTARPRVRSTTSASASVSSGPAVTRASLPPRRGFFSSRNRNNLNEEPNKPKEESNSVSVTTVSSNTVAGSSTTTAASRKFGSNATNNRSRGFAPSRSRDSSSVSSTTQAPISRFTSSSTSAPSSVNSSPNSSSNSINAARLNSLRGRPSFSRSRQPAVTRGVSSRGQPATIPSSNKKDEPSNVAVTATSDKPEDKKTETSSVTATSDKPEDKKSETSSSDNSSSIVTESTTQQSTTVNSRSRNNPLFRSRPRSNLFGNRG